MMRNLGHNEKPSLCSVCDWQRMSCLIKMHALFASVAEKQISTHKLRYFLGFFFFSKTKIEHSSGNSKIKIHGFLQIHHEYFSATVYASRCGDPGVSMYKHWVYLYCEYLYRLFILWEQHLVFKSHSCSKKVHDKIIMSDNTTSLEIQCYLNYCSRALKSLGEHKAHLQ